MNGKTDLSRYSNHWYKPGGGFIGRGLWYMTNLVFFNSYFPLSAIRVLLLRIFGAKVGKGVIIKPSVNIKYPWHLEIGDHVWLGEDVWIDNLAHVKIGNHVCISQGAMLLTGNHDYKKSTFDLKIDKIILEDGVWIGAQALVAPGITCKSHSVLSVKSVAVTDLEPYSIYHGNPAEKVRERVIGE